MGPFAGDEVFAYGHEWEATVADCGAPWSRFSEQWTDMNILDDPSLLFSISYILVQHILQLLESMVFCRKCYT